MSDLTKHLKDDCKIEIEFKLKGGGDRWQCYMAMTGFRNGQAESLSPRNIAEPFASAIATIEQYLGDEVVAPDKHDIPRLRGTGLIVFTKKDVPSHEEALRLCGIMSRSISDFHGGPIIFSPLTRPGFVERTGRGEGAVTMDEVRSTLQRLSIGAAESVELTALFKRALDNQKERS